MGVDIIIWRAIAVSVSVCLCVRLSLVLVHSVSLAVESQRRQCGVHSIWNLATCRERRGGRVSECERVDGKGRVCRSEELNSESWLSPSFIIKPQLH